MLYVNTGDVLSLADRVDTINNNLTNALDNVTSAMQSLNGAWSGEAGENAIKIFNQLNNDCIELQSKAVADYADFLRRRVSEGYEQVEQANVSLSDAFK